MRLRRPREISVSLSIRPSLSAAGERKLLVDHRQDASTGRFDGDDGTVHVAKSINGCLANDWIFTGGDIAFSNFRCKGTRVETLVITTAAAMGCRVARTRSAAARQ